MYSQAEAISLIYVYTVLSVLYLPKECPYLHQRTQNKQQFTQNVV